ncbi:MAG: ribosome small subunit-dependent GTPase A [Gemmatimonadales bacterium]
MSELSGVVLVRTGNVYRVHAETREIGATLAGRLKHLDADRIVPGDVVTLEIRGSDGTEGCAVITGLRPRRSVLARREAAGGGSKGRSGATRAQPIAANVDQVVVVASTVDPKPNPRALDRFFVIAEANALPAALVINKVDLARAPLDALARRYAPAGYPVLPTSVKTPEGLAALRDLLRGRHSVFSGASGVGKSSLLNALDPGLDRRIGAISEAWRTGRHTTTAAELVPVGGIGYVVDTPGLREVGAWGIAGDSLGACFPEFRPHLDHCRFDDCRHRAEPGCAVRAAAERGAFDPDRLVSYERIYEEVNVPFWSTARHRER